MKKIIIITVILSVFLISKKFSDEIIIPKDAIRFRVIANSNKDIDQNIKKNVASSLNKELTNILGQSENIDESRNKIINNYDAIENNIVTTLKNNNIDESFNISYGMNYFPKKEYKGITYEEGNYESLVVTLGEGLGDNWWCVLFPPLCLLEAEENKTDEVEYKLFINKILDKFSK